MDFGALEVQIFVSLTLVLGAVFVSLLCDFLKGNNEALRERNIELVVRQEERARYTEPAVIRSRHQVETRRAQPAQPAPASVPQAAPAASAARASTQTTQAPVTQTPPARHAARPARSTVEVTPAELDTTPIEAPEPDVAPANGEWATPDELSEIEAVAARIRQSVERSSSPFRKLARETEQDEEAPARKSSEAEEEESRSATRTQWNRPVVEQEATEVSEAEATEEPLREETWALEPEFAEDTLSLAAEEEPKPAGFGVEESPEPAVEFPRLTLHAKVTPIDVVAAEREAATEAIRLARELERVAKATNLDEDTLDYANEIEEEGESVEQPGAQAEEEFETAAPELDQPQVEAGESEGEGEWQDVPLFAGEIDEEAAADEQGMEPAAAEQFAEPAAVEQFAETAAEEIAEETEVEPVFARTSATFFDDESVFAVDEEAAKIEEVVAEEEESKTVTMPDRAAVTEPAVAIPSGFQDYSALATALESEAVFRGTVVAISVNNFGNHAAPSGDTLEDVRNFVASLMTQSDFGCQSNDDEFLLILPDEMGAQSQRRIQYVSQRLWDYQIRSVGTQTIMFSWGAAETTGEPLRDAISAAKDRMLQTKRNRERASSEIHHYRVRAAND